MNPEKTPYDFIMDPAQKRNAPLSPAGALKQKFIPIALFLVFIITAIIVAFSLLSSIGKTNNQDLINVQAQQTELLRIINLGQKNLSDITVKNKLATLDAIVTTDEKQVSDLLTTRKEIVTKLQLNALTDKDIDASFESARQDGTYDAVVQEAVSSRSNKYYSALKTSFAEASTAKEKQLLKTAIENLETTIQ